MSAVERLRCWGREGPGHAKEQPGKRGQRLEWEEKQMELAQ